MTTRPKLRLSPSKMILWNQCPAHLKAALDKQTEGGDNIYSCIGTAAHWVVEQLNNGTVWTPDEREDQFHKRLEHECKEKNVGLEFPKGYKESKATIMQYEVPEGWHFLHAENKRLLQFDDFDFSYIIDANFTDAEGKALRIVDYKTSSARPSTNLQLQLYGWAETIRLDLNPDDISSYFWMLRWNELVEVKFDRETFNKIDVYMRTSAKLINALLDVGAEFDRTPGHCYYCPLKDCPVRK